MSWDRWWLRCRNFTDEENARGLQRSAKKSICKVNQQENLQTIFTDKKRYEKCDFMMLATHLAKLYYTHVNQACNECVLFYQPSCWLRLFLGLMDGSKWYIQKQQRMVCWRHWPTSTRIRWRYLMHLLSSCVLEPVLEPWHMLWREAGRPVIYIQKDIMANEKTEQKKQQQVT